MEENKNKRFSQILSKSMSQLMVILVSIIVFFTCYRFTEILNIVKLILSTIQPILIGLALGYVLKRPQKFFYKKIFLMFTKSGLIKKEEQAKKVSKALSIFLALITFIVIIYVLIIMAVPQIVDNIMRLADTLPEQMNSAVAWISAQLEENSKYAEIVKDVSKEITDYITRWIKTDMMAQIAQVASGIISVVSLLLNVIIGLIVAVYVLASKETFARQGKKIIYAMFSEARAEKILKEFKRSDDIFGGFISGKIIDSLIIGIICFVGMTVLRLPYIALVSMIVGVTNVIPFFGPYIGAVPSAILILLAEPKKGLIFIVFIILLQQLDGNVIGPKILGESTGLSPFWVVFSILLGGGLFGIIGMLVGVPTFAVIYNLIAEIVNERIKQKNVNPKKYETTQDVKSSNLKLDKK